MYKPQLYRHAGKIKVCCGFNTDTFNGEEWNVTKGGNNVH